MRTRRKKSKKVPKNLDKKIAFLYTALARNANAFHFIQSLLSGRACSPAAHLIWALLLSVKLHGCKCRRIVCTSYFTVVLYHVISDGCTGAGAFVRVTSGKLGREQERVSSACVSAKMKRKEKDNEGCNHVVCRAWCGSGGIGFCGGGLWRACSVGVVLGSCTVCPFPCLVRWEINEKQK